MGIKVWQDYPSAIDLRNPLGERLQLGKNAFEVSEPFPRDCLVHVTATEDVWVSLNGDVEGVDGYLVYGGATHTAFRVSQGDVLAFFNDKPCLIQYHTITWKP